MEGYHGLSTTDYGNDAQPVLCLFGNLDRNAIVGLAAQGDGYITAFNGDGSIQGVITLDLDERLLNLDNGHVNELDSTVIDGLGTLDSDDVTHLETEAEEVLGVALGVESTIDVDFAGLVTQVPVTIGRIDD